VEKLSEIYNKIARHYINNGFRKTVFIINDEDGHEYKTKYFLDVEPDWIVYVIWFDSDMTHGVMLFNKISKEYTFLAWNFFYTVIDEKLIKEMILDSFNWFQKNINALGISSLKQKKEDFIDTNAFRFRYTISNKGWDKSPDLKYWLKLTSSY